MHQNLCREILFVQYAVVTILHVASWLSAGTWKWLFRTPFNILNIISSAEGFEFSIASCKRWNPLLEFSIPFCHLLLLLTFLSTHILGCWFWLVFFGGVLSADGVGFLGFFFDACYRSSFSFLICSNSYFYFFPLLRDLPLFNVFSFSGLCPSLVFWVRFPFLLCVLLCCWYFWFFVALVVFLVWYWRLRVLVFAFDFSGCCHSRFSP